MLNNAWARLWEIGRQRWARKRSTKGVMTGSALSLLVHAELAVGAGYRLATCTVPMRVHVCRVHTWQSGKEKTHKQKQICGIVPGLGGCQNFAYVFLFFRVIPYGGEKHINKIPPKIPGQSREHFVYVCFSLCFFRSLDKRMLLDGTLATSAKRYLWNVWVCAHWLGR